MRLRLLVSAVVVLAAFLSPGLSSVAVAQVSSPLVSTGPLGAPSTWQFADVTTQLLLLRQHLIDKAETGKKPPSILDGVATYRGNDSCQWANDGECDDPGIGTGACQAGTDYSDCWRIATQQEDDSCEYARDGECDEPHFGTGACAQGTDRTDCGDVTYLRNEDDTCINALNGVCNEPGTGDGTCAAGTDRGDCVGRDRPLTIADHYFGHDDRVLVDMQQFPWSVIGMLSDDAGICTATLVAPNVVVTAAHCIETESGIDAREVFTTDFAQDGTGGRSANAVAWLQSPDRAHDVATSDEPSMTDWALIRIDQPLGAKLGFVGARGMVGFYGAQEPLTLPIYQAGYAWDTGDHLSGMIGTCNFLAIENDNKVSHNCDTTHGDSGSPLMFRDGDNYYIVATDSTFRIVTGEPTVNIATRSDGWVDYLDDFAAGRIGNTTLVVNRSPSKFLASAND